MSDGFLARWSRRKRDEARRIPDVPPEGAAPAAPAVAPEEDAAALTPEELAQLPSLDVFTAATDLTPFLRAGVPRALRNAALRRMWSIDPAIRDFVSEAREYAYDWNTPGGVPGTGGALSAEDVRAMVEKVFGGGEEKPAPDQPETDEASTCSPPLQAMPGSPGIAARCGRGDGREGDTLPDETLTVGLPAQRAVLDPEAEPLSRDLRSPLPLSHTVQRYRASPASPGEGIPRQTLNPPGSNLEPPPAPPRLRRHGGALPI